MSRRWIACALMWVLAGCSEHLVAQVKLEEVTGAESAVLMFRRNAGEPGQPDVYAFDLASSSDFDLPAHFVDGTELITTTVIYVEATLAEVNLNAGDVPLGGNPGVPLSLILEPHGVAATRTVTVDTSAPSDEFESVVWQDTDVPETPVDYGCAELKAEGTRVNACSNLAFAITTGPNQLEIGTRDQRFFDVTVNPPGSAEPYTISRDPDPVEDWARPDEILTRERCQEIGRTPPPAGARRVHSAIRDPSGAVFYGSDNALIHIAADGQRRLLPLRPPVSCRREVNGQPQDLPAEWMFLAGNTDLDSSGFELWALTARGMLARITRTQTGTTAEWFEDLRDCASRTDLGGISYAGPSDVAAGIAFTTDILRYRNGGVDLEQPVPIGWAVAKHFEGVGHVFAGEIGQMIANDGDSGPLEGGWREVPLTGDWGSRIDGLGEFSAHGRDGFLFSGTNGFMAQFITGTGFCPTTQQAAHTPTRIIQLEHGVFVAGRKDFEPHLALNLLRVVPRTE